MEHKKNPKIDIYRMQRLFFSIGLCISLTAIFIIFEYKVYDQNNIIDLGSLKEDTDEILDIPQTVQPPPPPPKMQLPDIVEIPNEELIIEDIDLNLDIEMHQETTIENVPFDESMNTDEPGEEKADEIFLIVEQQAEPVGGVGAFYEYVASQMKDNYPEQALRMNIEGVVYIQFVVEKDGSLTNVLAAKGIGFGCDELAVEVVENAPKWKPGKQRGKPVRSRQMIPIRFKLMRK